MSEATMEAWVQSVVDAMLDAGMMLGFEDSDVNEDGDSPGDDFIGANIAVVGDEHAVQLGVLSSPDQADKIARAMLGMEPDEDLPHSDMADAIGEIANIIAGGVKGAMVDDAPGLRLGLPVFSEGPFRKMGRTEEQTIHFNFGQAWLVVQLLVASTQADLSVSTDKNAAA